MGTIPVIEQRSSVRFSAISNRSLLLTMAAPDTAAIPELACTYASLILHDDKVPITDDKINAILKAANVDIPAVWAKIFANVLADQDIDSLILNSGGGGGGAAPAAAAAGGDAAPAEEEAKEESEEEESDEDMGFGL